ncbi:hypothetical protein [Mesorhizobium sp. P13.3]|uniref:hypothetical protein n=1 Tax=Mesorhizobium sp. P13.3 TaxID=2976703 RepID=UPI0026A58263
MEPSDKRDICAVDHDKYLIGDADLSPAELETVLPERDRIEETYGDRDFLKLEIVALPALDRKASRQGFVGDALVRKSEKLATSIPA